MSNNVRVITPNDAGKRFVVDGVERLVTRVGDSAVLATRIDKKTKEIIIGLGGLRESNNIVLVQSGRTPDGKPAYVTYGSPTGPRAFFYKGEKHYQTVNLQLRRAEYSDRASQLIDLSKRYKNMLRKYLKL